MMSPPILLVADKNKQIYDLPGFLACGQAGPQISVLSPKQLIPLPKDSNLFFLPNRYPVGFNIQKNTYEPMANCSPVAAFIPPGYTQTLTAAYAEAKDAELLPLFSYAPVAYYKGAFYIPAIRIDQRKNHDLSSLDKKMLCKKIQVFEGTKNRLITHLAGCAQVNSCPNAINFFLGKYEAPLPVSPSCNARCLGCISAQPKGSCPATQPRITFVPTPEEIAEVALTHINRVSRSIVSFGQGCEGEPLLNAAIIKKAINIIRKETSRGTIHMNTNAGRTKDVEALCKAGLNSMRVSLNSVRPDLYHSYYSPRDYTFSDVIASIVTAKQHKKFIALNYLVMPGLTDTKEEFQKLVKFIHKTRVDMIQWRNLNYDPQRYLKKMDQNNKSPLLGIKTIIQLLQKQFPKLRHGYFNIPQ
ncbi:MAG: radical SAM protein [Candidatus Omnitrophica bacterium]|nr:radical SAM protein [Candidatus Omnitrophota bacterium]